MTARRIAVLGGGPFVAKLIDALLTRDDLAALEIRLVARNFTRLEIIAHHCQERASRLRPEWQIRAQASTHAALDGAEVVIVLIRAGGLAARIIDETFPRAYDLAGDEGLGPGGMANALRTTSVLAPIIDQIKEHAPQALVANLVAPLGITTRQLCEAGLHAVGLCELPVVTERQLLNALPPDLRSHRFAYGGFNHLGWFWPLEDADHILDSVSASGLADRSVVEHFGAIPLRYYYKIFDRDAATRLGFDQDVGRAAFLQKLSDQAVADMAESPGGTVSALQKRPTPWFDVVVAPFVAAALGNRSYVGFLNLVNSGRLLGLSPKLVVETRASLTSAQTAAVLPTGVPPMAAQFLAAIGEAEDCLYRACLGESRRALLAALSTLPLGLPARVQKALADDILGAAKEEKRRWGSRVLDLT